MQVTAHLYDWKWVQSADSFAEFMNLLESEEAESKVHLCWDIIPKWADSHNMWTNAGFILKWIEENTDDNTANLIRKGIYPVVSENSFIDDLNYSEASEGHYFPTLSPATISLVAAAFNAIDLTSLHALAEKAPRDLFYDSGITSEDELIQYLKQWLQLLNAARERGMGIICHIG